MYYLKKIEVNFKENLQLFFNFLDRTTLEKTINKINFKIKTYEVNDRIKHYEYIKNTDFIFIVFDFLNRDSFEAVVETWKEYLIDTVNYSNKLYLLGNFFKEGKHLTEINEIDDLLNEIKEEKGVKIDYFEIGNNNDEKIEKLIDDIIFKTFVEKKKNSKSGKCSEAGSCFIF